MFDLNHFLTTPEIRHKMTVVLNQNGSRMFEW